MRIEMLKNFPVAANGHTVKERKKGDVIEVDEELGAVLQRDKIGSETNKEVNVDLPAAPASEPAPELDNKAVDQTPARKKK